MNFNWEMNTSIKYICFIYNEYRTDINISMDVQVRTLTVVYVTMCSLGHITYDRFILN